MRLSLLFLTFISLASPCLAEVITTTSTEYYTVQGTTKNEILKNMTRQSPKVSENRFSVAHHNYVIKYEASLIKQNGLCSTDKVTIHLQVIYRYPRLAQTPTRKTRQWWDEYFRNLEKHELIHGDITRKGTANMDKKLNSIKNIDCYNIKGIVQVRANKMMKKIKADHDAYDKLTDHGIKQNRYKAH